MQLDKTQIAIRERGILDTLDLSLHVSRSYAWQLVASMAITVLPLMLLNQLLIGWMFADIDNEIDFPVRYVWHMSLLIFIQAPLASVVVTAFLGQAVFLDRPRIRSALSDVRRMAPRLLWSQVIIRGPAASVLLVLSIDKYSGFDPFIEGFVPVCLVFYCVLVRAFRPFINEVVLLERNPLTSRNRDVMTIGRRSAMLHGPSSGDLMFGWIGSLLIGFSLFLSFLGAFVFLSGVFLNDWSMGPWMLQLCMPLAMWMVAGFFAVYRFLSYLDLRIRQEGWEVELRMRAEAARIRAKYVGT